MESTHIDHTCTVKLALLGGDLRQMVTAKSLAEDGYEVAVWGIDTYAGDWGGVTRAADLCSAVCGADLVVLPLPVTQDDIRLHCPLTKKNILLKDIFCVLTPGQQVIGGKVTEAVRTLASEYGITVSDYLQREELAVANAVPTAEGALAIAMAEVPYTIHGARCLVLGYGRIGKTLAHTLSAIGANVTVAARKAEDLAWIRSNGHTALSMEDLLCDDGGPLSYDIVFNTVPKQIVGASLLSRLPKDVLLLDLASAPGGIDRDYAETHGYHIVWALSLPGKTAPVTAGKIIGESIRSILKEQKHTEKAPGCSCNCPQSPCCKETAQATNQPERSANP
ncbi:MAG: dipicolinate synthase subunit DpsA [Clostridia bacterium]|nr:dipicolinate synthase subunit DpsA [Clostridia bacterium]